MTYVADRVTGFEHNRVLGMSGTLDSARLRQLVARELGVAASSITPMNIGEHGKSMLPLSGYTAVGGVPLSHLIDPQRLSDILSATRGVAADIISRKGATVHGPAATVTVVADAIIHDVKAVMNVSTYLDG